MTKLLDLIPSWVLALIAALALLSAGLERTQVLAAKVQVQMAKADLEKQRADMATAQAAAEKRERDKEAQRAADVQEVATHAQSQIDSLAADLADSRGVADSLRAAVDSARRRACPSASASGAGTGQPGADPIGVLADVFTRADQRAGELAEYADRLRIAGTGCERAYDALTR